MVENVRSDGRYFGFVDYLTADFLDSNYKSRLFPKNPNMNTNPSDENMIQITPDLVYFVLPASYYPLHITNLLQTRLQITKKNKLM